MGNVLGGEQQEGEPEAKRGKLLTSLDTASLSFTCAEDIIDIVNTALDDPHVSHETLHLAIRAASFGSGFRLVVTSSHQVSLSQSRQDEFQSKPCDDLIWDLVRVQGFAYSSEQVAALSDESNDRATLYLSALCLRDGKAGFPRDEETACHLFGLAASQGHAYAGFQHANCLSMGIGCEVDPAAALEAHRRAADAGVGESCFALGQCEAFEENYLAAAVYYFQGARDGDMGCMLRLSDFQRYYHLPLGQWQPLGKIHALVPHDIHQQMKTWMLIRTRISVDKHVALLVASYICTE